MRAISFGLAALVLVAATGARADTRTVQHVVRSSDTLEGIAAEYYGNRALAQLVAEANGVRGKLRAGQRLRIPSAFHYRARRNDTLELVAARYLGDKRRASFLGQWAGMKPGDKLREGQDLLVPYPLVHKASAPEALATIAHTYYGDSSQARMLQAYNFRGSPMLAKGEKLVVPIANVRVRAVHLAHAATPTVAKAGTPVQPSEEEEEAALAKRVAARLADAERYYLDGNYTEVPAALTKLLSEEDPSESQLVEIHRLLAFAYVALGADEVAVKEFHEVIERDPDAKLDPATVSPKIRAAFDRAKQGN